MAAVAHQLWMPPRTDTVTRGHRALGARFQESEAISVYLEKSKALSEVPSDVDGYLSFITTRDFAGGGRAVSVATADVAKVLWRDLRARLASLARPSVAPGPDGCIGFSWDSSDHHFSAEIFPDGHVELFHEDMRSGALWEEEVTVSNHLSEEAISRLRKFE